jgi:uncharacterized protein (TIRG00374 family)
MKRLVSSSLMIKVIISLLLGISLLFLISRFVNIVVSIDVVLTNLATPHGMLLACLSGVAFLLAFSIRGLRWKLFLSSISAVRASTAIRIFLVSIFINFLLPISSGEIAKTLMLKRVAGIPMSRSLPTVAMDRSLDLLPALVIMIVVPLLGMAMEIRLWVVLSIVGGLLIFLASFIGLTVWKRSTAIVLLHRIRCILPGAIGEKIEAFATGFVDSLLASASRPHIFLLALSLTCLAVVCDSLFAMFAFWTVGLPISFGTVIFGYTVYNMFFILPTPPGQIGSNEAVGLLVFTGLLQQPSDKVTAMFIFSHLWAALLMCSTALICLKTLGLTISTTMKVQPEESHAECVEKQEKLIVSSRSLDHR